MGVKYSGIVRLRKMKIKSLIEFSGVPKGSTGIAEKDDDLWKITWDDIRVFYGIPFIKRQLVDWFDEYEFKKYLEPI